MLFELVVGTLLALVILLFLRERWLRKFWERDARYLGEYAAELRRHIERSTKYWLEREEQRKDVRDV